MNIQNIRVYGGQCDNGLQKMLLYDMGCDRMIKVLNDKGCNRMMYDVIGWYGIMGLLLQCVYGWSDYYSSLLLL